MSLFLVEVRFHGPRHRDAALACSMLATAERRVGYSGSARILAAGVSGVEGSLVCLVEAAGEDVVRRLLGVAFLSPGRVEEISVLPHRRRR